LGSTLPLPAVRVPLSCTLRMLRSRTTTMFSSLALSLVTIPLAPKTLGARVHAPTLSLTCDPTLPTTSESERVMAVQQATGQMNSLRPPSHCLPRATSTLRLRVLLRALRQPERHQQMAHKLACRPAQTLTP